ncbi:MAG: exodeoxyribonuclease III [Bdellovibrionales bacterium]|nr:exodeoxyribonuclease III [Bdellovibrionales bacterium]
MDRSILRMGGVLKLVTWNVNGIRAISKKGFLEYIEREDADFYCLQETKAHPEQLDEQLIHLPHRTSYWSSALRRGYSGTVTYLREKPQSVHYGIDVRRFDSEGRFVITEHPSFSLYNVYFPNGSSCEERHLFKQQFLEKFRRHLVKKLKEGRELIVVGDYNVAYRDIDVYDPIRLSKASGFLPEEREWFGRFLDSGFVDVFAHFYPHQKDNYTWWSYRENARIANRGWRIDHICLSRGLLNRVQSIEIQNEQHGSDHCPVVLELET